MTQELLPSDRDEQKNTVGDMVVPLEKQAPGRKLDGTEGLYRVDPSLPRMIRANTDLEAIQEWLETTTKADSSTRRSYRKEVERLLAWAIVEKGKPVSSLDMQDIREYREFLAQPISEVGVIWTAHERYDDQSEEWVPIITDSRGKTIKKRYQRSDPNWKPFDGPLSPSSVDFSLRVLKGFFNFLNQFGYLQLNPMALSVKSSAPVEKRKDQVASRSLDLDTWRFVYEFVQQQKNQIPDHLDSTPKDRLYWIRTWNRNQVVFATLYLLGVRISELQGLKMNDFHRRQLKNPHTGIFATTWWVKVLGKGNKLRDIPVPDQLVELIREYRRALNDFPHRDRIDPRSASGRGGLVEELGTDDSALIRNLSGNLGISTNRLQVSIKQVLAQALERYQNLKDNGASPHNVDAQKLEFASAHWLRHTSATHQGYGEIDDGQLQLNLGHASIDTTRIYKHEDEALRANATRDFKIRFGQSSETPGNPRIETDLDRKPSSDATVPLNPVNRTTGSDVQKAEETVVVTLWLRVEKNGGWVSDSTVRNVRSRIENRVLVDYRAKKYGRGEWNYWLYINTDVMGEYFSECLHQIEIDCANVAEDSYCWVECEFRDENNEFKWNYFDHRWYCDKDYD